LAEAERLRQSLLADAGRGDLLKTIIDRVSSVAHAYSWLRAGLLANFENRLLGRTVSVDWIGVALALVGIGIALLPLADQFNFLKPYAVPGGVALILAGLLCA
jgi:hypothetical protein